MGKPSEATLRSPRSFPRIWTTWANSGLAIVCSLFALHLRKQPRSSSGGRQNCDYWSCACKLRWERLVSCEALVTRVFARKLNKVTLFHPPSGSQHTMHKVLITPATLAGLDGAFLRVLKDAGFEILFPSVCRQLTEEELLRELKGVKATLAGSEPYTPRVFKEHPQLRAIARAGVGFDAVDVAAATEQGVAVAIAPGTNQESVAEHTFALILALAKNVVSHHHGTRVGSWPRQANLPLRGRTLGIAGLGRIGKAVAVRGIAFSMKLLAYEPYPDNQFVSQHKIPLVSMDRLLAESDYLTLHMPFTPESRHLINRHTLAKMKRSA